MDFGMNHAPNAGWMAPPIDLQSSVLLLCNDCLQYGLTLEVQLLHLVQCKFSAATHLLQGSQYLHVKSLVLLYYRSTAL